MRMRFSVGMGRNLRIDEIARHARVADECGFTHLTYIDSQNLCRDVYSMMTIGALNTSRIHIGHGVSNPYTRHPSVTACATATVDELSGGRAFLGIGAGFSALRTMEMHNARPMREFRNVVEFVRAYTRGEEVEYGGVKCHSEWIRRQLPIYMASAGIQSARMSGEIADGVMLPGSEPLIAKWYIERLREGAARNGRDLGNLDIWTRTMIYVADSKEAARREVASYAATCIAEMHRSLFSRDAPEIEALKADLERKEPGIVEEMAYIARIYDPYEHERIDAPHGKAISQRLIDLTMLTGTAEEICDRIAELGEIGVTNISTVLFTIIDKMGMMEKVRDEVMTYFRS